MSPLAFAALYLSSHVCSGRRRISSARVSASLPQVRPQSQIKACGAEGEALGIGDAHLTGCWTMNEAGVSVEPSFRANFQTRSSRRRPPGRCGVLLVCLPRPVYPRQSISIVLLARCTTTCVCYRGIEWPNRIQPLRVPSKGEDEDEESESEEETRDDDSTTQLPALHPADPAPW